MRVSPFFNTNCQPLSPKGRERKSDISFGKTATVDDMKFNSPFFKTALKHLVERGDQSEFQAVLLTAPDKKGIVEDLKHFADNGPSKGVKQMCSMMLRVWKH